MIYYFICCYNNINTGKGGFYYSLANIAKNISDSYTIYVIGDFFPSAYVGEKNIVFMKHSRAKTPFAPDILNSRDPKPRLLHCFDLNTATYAARLSFKHKIPMVITKPGGPPQWKYFFPYRHQVVFQKTDEAAFKASPLRPDKVYLIPQRVSLPAFPFERENIFGSTQSTLKLLCVTRISKTYRNKILQSINLLKRLRTNCVKAELCIVGYVEDEQIYFELKRQYNDKDIKFFVDDHHTHLSSEYAHYADVIVGSGRSLMEGMACYKFCFFPVSGSTLPCLLTPENYSHALANNFSDRITENAKISPDREYSAFMKILKDKSLIKQYTRWQEAIFSKDHSGKTGGKKHDLLYNTISNHERYSTYVVNSTFIVISSVVQYVRWAINRIPRTRE